MFVIQPQRVTPKGKSEFQEKIAERIKEFHRYAKAVRTFVVMVLIAVLIEAVKALFFEDSCVIVLFDTQDVLGMQWTVFGLTISVFSIWYTLLEKELSTLEQGGVTVGENEVRQHREGFRKTATDLEELICLLVVNTVVLGVETFMLSFWDLTTARLALVLVEGTLLYCLWIMFQLVCDIRARAVERKGQTESLNERIKHDRANSGGCAGETVADHTKMDDKVDPPLQDESGVVPSQDVSNGEEEASAGSAVT